MEILNNQSVAITTRTFRDLHFSMMLPEAIMLSDRIILKTTFCPKVDSVKIDSIFSGCKITDRVKVVHETTNNYEFIQSGARRKIEVAMAYGSKKVFLTEALVEFTFLCSNNKKIVICYIGTKDHKLQFNHIEIFDMTLQDEKQAQEIVANIFNEENKQRNVNEIQENILTKNEAATASYTSKTIEDYSKALIREIAFLRAGKGKKYKVINGEKIGKLNQGMITYSFELETELYLPSDAPILLETTSGTSIRGTILSCEEFEILLLFHKEIGEKIRIAHLSVEPWKLLDALNERILTLDKIKNPLAIKLLSEGPKLSTFLDISKVQKGHENIIDKITSEDITFVWGPPGTGKTHTMASAAIEFLMANQSILIVSHSNVSVDGVVKKILQLLDTKAISYCQRGKILRVGFVRDKELAENKYATSFNYAKGKNKVFQNQLDKQIEIKKELTNEGATKTEEYNSVMKEIKTLQEIIHLKEREYISNAQLIATTISRATLDPLFEENKYDVVMFDEASMAYVPHIIAAAAIAKLKFICVGDFKQLPPISQNKAAELLQTDIFSFLKIVDEQGKMFYHPWMAMLDEQRRMHPHISAFPRKYIYDNQLLDHKTVKINRESMVQESPFEGEAMNLIDLAGTYCASAKNSDGSRYNILSAILSFAIAMSRTKNKRTVGIITPYAAQTRLIRALIKDYKGGYTNGITCATVHQYQGSESDFIIFDAVESYPKNAVGVLMGKRNNQVKRLINVAITRARGKLIVVANDYFWKNLFEGTNHIFYKLLSYIKANHHVVCQKENTLEPYIESLKVNKSIRIYTKEARSIGKFTEDVMRAEQKIIVSIPDGVLHENAKNVLVILKKAEKKGIEIFIKSKDIEHLPKEWKEHATEADNSVFPLILIDDKILWYGIPTSELKFNISDTKKCKTVINVIARLEGENTIEIIKSLTELETVQNGKSKIPILNEAKNPYEKTKLKLGGLAKFVEQKEFCPKCKSKMVLLKNHKGTFYLKCSGKECSERKFLKKELMTWYIEMNNVKCPENDGGYLTAKVGSYGPYIACSKGHYLKPNEI